LEFFEELLVEDVFAAVLLLQLQDSFNLIPIIILGPLFKVRLVSFNFFGRDFIIIGVLEF
jgi:hypothetical protein